MTAIAPGRLALLDIERAEARDDLNAIMLCFHSKAGREGEDAAVDWFVRGLVNAPDWDRQILATVLAEAVARLSRGVAS